MEQSITIEEYKQQMHRMLKMLYPSITNYELDLAIQYSIDKRFKNVDITVNNNYKRRTVNTTLLEVSDIIKTQQPIITAYGVMFKRHGTVPNPLMKMIAGFINDRKKLKKQMFKFPKGSDDYEKYNLLQLLEKLNANGLI